MAGDTFRAAAIEQLKIWSERTGSGLVSGETGADAAGLAYEALAAARTKGTDVLIVDTAGRLQNKTALMGELDKIVRVVKKLDPTAPHAVLLVLDATVGQNALSQVGEFQKTAGVTGLVMTKLDGTARGGILVALAAKYGLPVHFIGVGEGVDDLAPFAAADFARAPGTRPQRARRHLIPTLLDTADDSDPWWWLKFYRSAALSSLESNPNSPASYIASVLDSGSLRRLPQVKANSNQQGTKEPITNV